MTSNSQTSTVLCAVDGLTEANVVRAASRLATDLGSTLILAHALDPSGTDARSGPGRLAPDERDRALGVLHRARAELPAGAAEADERVLLGESFASLGDLAERERAELIVVGSRGLGPLASALVGSFSRELVRRFARPVVVVPPDADVEGRGPLVCGVDASERAPAVARVAADLARRMDDRLLLVHARRSLSAGARVPLALHPAEMRAAEELLGRVATGVDSRADTLVIDGPPALELGALANRENARLLVVGSRGLGNLRGAMLGSVSAELMRVAARPVLVVPDAAQAGSAAA